MILLNFFSETVDRRTSAAEDIIVQLGQVDAFILLSVAFDHADPVFEQRFGIFLKFFG